MQPLNYHHLLYFYKVAKLGSIARASAELQLTQPTISEQIRLLEKSLGKPLFDRVGRALVLTEAGKTAFAYAENIFALGQDLTHSLHNQGIPAVLRIGVDPRLSSPLAASLLPSVPMEVSVANAGDPNLDLFLTPAPAKGQHLLLDCGALFLSRRKQTLKQVKLLLPPEPMRSTLKSWLKKKKLSPSIAATFESDALLLAYAQLSDAAFLFPDHKLAIPRDFHVIARANDIRFSVFAVTNDRQSTHSAVAKLLGRKG